MLFQCYLRIVILSSSLLIIQQGFHFMIYDLNIIIIVLLMIYAAADMKIINIIFTTSDSFYKMKTKSKSFSN